MKQQAVVLKAKSELFKMRGLGIGYLVVVIVIYEFYRLVIVKNLLQLSGFWADIADVAYFLLTVVVPNLISHCYCLKGLWSFVCKKKILKQLIEKRKLEKILIKN